MSASRFGAIVSIVLMTAPAFAQRPAAPATQPPSARAAAPVDLTGYWVSPVMEDWRWRMVTPLKGDAASIPVNSAARTVIDAWDPAADEAAGDRCKAYGAPALLRVPGRLRIRWQDDDTLEIAADAGEQTRLLRFGAPPDDGVAPSRTLEATTTRLLPGYLRKNGVPYSGDTIVQEYFDRFTEPDGNEWFTVTTIVIDPVYLGAPFVTTTDYRKERDGSEWNPRPCTAR